MTTGMLAPEMAEILASHADFQAEMSAVEHILKENGACGFFGAVCHPELAFIEQKWAQLKQHLRCVIDDTEATLVREMIEGLSKILVESNRASARHCRECMHAYRVLRAAAEADPNSTVSPSEVAVLCEEQKRHRMPYASVVAGLVVAANTSTANAALIERRAEVLKTRRAQVAQAAESDDKQKRRKAAVRRKQNNKRSKAKLDSKRAEMARKHPTVSTN